MIKIALDTSALSGKSGIRGVGFYTERLIEAFNHFKKENFEVRPLNFRYTSKSDLLKYSIWHYPSFDPFFLTLPWQKLKPIIVTVHDLIPIKFIQHFTPGLRGQIKWQIQKYLLTKSEAIITDSDCSKNDIIDIIKYPKNKIYRIYLAADQKFRPSERKKATTVLAKYSLKEKFILYVGDLNWNKNIQGLIKGFSKVSLQKPDLNLVIVGKAFLNKDLSERKEIINLINNLKLSSKIKLLGFIPTQDLVVLYNMAICLCQPSFWEGFGLPALEALSCGCPVVCSNQSSLKEIVGQTAILINPGDSEDIARGLKEAIFNKEKIKKLREKGITQARRFSWEKTAKQTLAVYQKVFNQRYEK